MRDRAQLDREHPRPKTRVELVPERVTRRPHQTKAQAPIETPPSSPSPPSSPGTLTPDSQASDLNKMADAEAALSKGALLKCTQGEDVGQPVVQCVQIKQMNNQNGVERWRIVMNDGVNFMQGMLAQREYQEI